MVSTSHFRTALSRFATGVTVVTAMQSGKPVGITISSFTSVSLEPLLILFCLDNKSQLLGGFLKGSAFAVHILSEKQADLARFFASKARHSWHNIPHKISAKDLPILDDVMAALVCKVQSVTAGGDHAIILAQVESLTINEKKRKPLLYTQRHYFRLGRKHQ